MNWQSDLFDKIWQAITFGLVFIAVWCLLHLLVLGISWLKSVSIAPRDTAFSLDLRNDKTAIGRTIILSAIKANPAKSIWFGHMWVVWPEAPPLATDGAKEAGYYAQCKIAAARGLLLSVLSPLALLLGQRPIKGVMRDDAGVSRDWQLAVQVDEGDYWRAIQIDTKWRQEQQYSMRPAFRGRTYTCRDYVFEVANAIGLSLPKNNWAQFPPETFKAFLANNGIELNPNGIVA